MGCQRPTPRRTVRNGDSQTDAPPGRQAGCLLVPAGASAARSALPLPASRIISMARRAPWESSIALSATSPHPTPRDEGHVCADGPAVLRTAPCRRSVQTCLIQRPAVRIAPFALAQLVARRGDNSCVRGVHNRRRHAESSSRTGRSPADATPLSDLIDVDRRAWWAVPADNARTHLVAWTVEPGVDVGCGRFQHSRHRGPAAPQHQAGGRIRCAVHWVSVHWVDRLPIQHVRGLIQLWVRQQAVVEIRRLSWWTRAPPEKAQACRGHARALRRGALQYAWAAEGSCSRFP